jgi:predicted restriction endonuclease
MEILNRYQKAALVSNTRRREKSLKEYYENPNICKCCGEIIVVGEKQKVREIRKKIFCSHSCSATFNNQQREAKFREPKEMEAKFREPKEREVKFREPKQKEVKQKKERFEFLAGLTKKDLIDKHGVYYKFRAVIRKQAHYIFNKYNNDKKCKVCGYKPHVEVCHIKSVSSFGNDALVDDINSIDNLVGLCPNHHWEFDNGIFGLSEIL